MKATEARLLEFLRKSPQFVIPIYQRTYSWGEKECAQLWDDIIRTGRNDDIPAHFVGSIVYVEKGLYSVSSQSPLLVIDGQQRLTTVSLLLEAVSRELGDSEPIEGFSAKKIRNYYLLNPLEDGDRRFKLLLSQTDRDSLKSLVEQCEVPKGYSIRIDSNFKYFSKLVSEYKNQMKIICNGLAKLVIVDISLSRDQDNPQLIFESLNSTGRELSQADLIRNFILMGLEPQEQTKLYQQYWRPMEIDFGQDAYNTYFDAFMRHYLIVKTGEIPNVRQVYEAFKKYAGSSKIQGVESLVSDIKTYANHFCSLALGAEKDLELKNAFRDIKELRVDVSYPFLLELYHDYKGNILTKEEFLEAARLIESYVFRRAVCGIPTNSLNKTFATFGRSLKKDRYLESIKAHFLLLPSYRRFPNDDEFKKDLKTKDLYNFRSRSYWLRRLENHGRKERVPVDEYTTEHILPQNEELSMEWRTELGEEWERIQKTYLHTLGNLTLTGYNSEYSDRPFREKRDMKGGFAESPLRLNKGLGTVEHWTEDTIISRADDLANRALTVWSIPKVDSEVLEAYKPTAELTGYSLDDHPNLAGGFLRELFEVFRKQVLALDPCVTEEFLKLYVAYKAETNFVDVVPQAKRLRLSLNMRFSDIDDPKGICKDVSGVGRWGNGDVEVGLASIEQLPYVMGLIRQSLERQIGNGEQD